MIDTAPRPDANLLQLLAARARHASDGRLAANALGGFAAAVVAAKWAGPAWELLLCAGMSFCCFGLWGIADRELGERPDAPIRTITTLRVVKRVAAIAGFASATLLALATLAILLGRMIS